MCSYQFADTTGKGESLGGQLQIETANTLKLQ